MNSATESEINIYLREKEREGGKKKEFAFLKRIFSESSYGNANHIACVRNESSCMHSLASCILSEVTISWRKNIIASTVSEVLLLNERTRITTLLLF